MSTTWLSVSNLVSLAFSLSPRSFSDADAAAVADHYVTLQQIYSFLHTPLDYSRLDLDQPCDLPLYSGITRRFYLRHCIKIYDSCITPM